MLVNGRYVARLAPEGHQASGEYQCEPLSAVIGTPGYVAPEEVVQGSSAVTQAVDVYGLAAVGFALLAGTPPAQGADLLDTLARAAAPATLEP